MKCFELLLWVYSPLIFLHTYSMRPSSSGLPLRYLINFSKAGMGPWIAALMLWHGNYSLGSWLYLGLHGSYGLIWLLKDLTFPDNTFKQPVGALTWVFTGIILGFYHVLPYLVTSGLGDQNPSPCKIFVCVAVYALGVFLMIGADAQKTFTLRVKSGLISDGLFTRTRNPNYLGEVLIYTSFGLMVQHWLALCVLVTVWSGLFVPLILVKEKSLRKKQGWVDYSRRSWMFLPKLVGGSDLVTSAIYLLAVAGVVRLMMQPVEYRIAPH